MAIEQVVASGFAEDRVADQNRHDVALARYHREPSLGEAAPQCCGALLVALALGLAGFEMADRASAPAAKAGGWDVVKMKPGAWLRTKSTSAAEPAT